MSPRATRPGEAGMAMEKDDALPGRDFGPPRGETLFHLWVSLGGLAILAAAVTLRGLSGIAPVEVVGLATAFFGGTAIWALRRLKRLGGGS